MPTSMIVALSQPLFPSLSPNPQHSRGCSLQVAQTENKKKSDMAFDGGWSSPEPTSVSFCSLPTCSCTCVCGVCKPQRPTGKTHLCGLFATSRHTQPHRPTFPPNLLNTSNNPCTCTCANSQVMVDGCYI